MYHAATAFLLLLGLTAAAEDKKKANTNALVKEFQTKLKVTASSYWPGWPPEYLIDGNLKKSWFSEKGDTVAKKTKPWVQVTFPRDVEVGRVTVHGNREEPWAKNYSFLAGKLELLDAAGKVLATEENDGIGEHKDFDFTFKKPVAKVRAVKFTALGDEGDKNPDDDVAIGEIEVE